MSENVATKLKLLEGYRFITEFGIEGVPNVLLDEPEPIGKGQGPGSARLLSAAIGYCLSSSLIYCLQKAKIDVRNMETNVNLYTMRNEEGRLRVKNIDVQISLVVDEMDRPRIQRCLEIFENYCTVTQSVMKGIEVSVKVT
ncbi:OsmC family protein [Candidatus Bathyarchaeota archaeon]|nr:OsmC family protein [Candidatus Bathyarchaeota archaeon]